MAWIDVKSRWLLLPAGDNEFIGSEPLESFETFRKVIGIQEMREMVFEVLVVFVIIAVYRSFFEGAVHPFPLSIGPRMIHLGQSVFDGMFLAYAIKNRGKCPMILVAIGKLDAIVGSHRVNAVRHRSNQVAQKLGGFQFAGAFEQLDIGQRGDPINRYLKREFACFSTDFSTIPMEVAKRIFSKGLLGGFLSFPFRESADAMALQATMEGRTSQLGNTGLQRIQTIIEWQ